MANGRVVLYDLWTYGHHVKYVRYLASHLLQAGYEVAFVTLRKQPSIELELADLPQLHIEYVAPDAKATTARDPVRLFLHQWKALTLCFRFAARWRATHVCIMYLDYGELPLLARSLLWRGRSWRLFGFLIWPYWSRTGLKEVTWAKRAYRLLRRSALRWLLKSGHMDCAFVHTEWAKNTLGDAGGANAWLEERVLVGA